VQSHARKNESTAGKRLNIFSFLNCRAGWEYPGHLQKLFQCIKYIVLEFTPSTITKPVIALKVLPPNTVALGINFPTHKP
jgi:hypothetical protein